MIRSRIVLVLAFALLLIDCSSSTPSRRISSSKTSATVTVKSDGKADQATIELCSRNGLTPSGVAVPSQVLWIAEDTTATLGIDFPDKGQNCITALRCSGNVCNGLTNTNVHGGNVQCTYHVTVNGTQTDPIIVIDDCCP